MSTSLFDRVAGLVEEIGIEKKAAYQEKRAGSQNMGDTSHPSDKEDIWLWLPKTHWDILSETVRVSLEPMWFQMKH